MNIWLKEVELEDDKRYCDLLIELANYENAYAHPVPSDFTYDDYEIFKKVRISMTVDSEENKTIVNTYWVMDDNIPIGYATLRRKFDIDKPGGHLGCCLKKEYQNKGIGSIVSNMLSVIAYNDYNIEKLIYTAKNENIQSQRSIDKIGGVLIDIHDGYHFYEVDLTKKFNIDGRKK